jgi:DNA-binding SARP family transcriptional activator
VHRVAKGYQMEVRAGELDVEQFRHLAAQGKDAIKASDARTAAALLIRALGFWRAPEVADIPATQEMLAKAGRLLEERRLVSEMLTDVRLVLGEDRSLVPELRAQVIADPANEKVWEQLIFALFRSGRRVDALAAYSQVRGVLSDLYGIDPGRRLQRLQHWILADHPALDHPSYVLLQSQDGMKPFIADSKALDPDVSGVSGVSGGEASRPARAAPNVSQRDLRIDARLTRSRLRRSSAGSSSTMTQE